MATLHQEGFYPYPFGLEPKRVVQALRELADRVEKGDCLVQSVDRSVKNKNDNYEMTELVVSYVEKTG
jgi:hypothetical protein